MAYKDTYGEFFPHPDTFKHSCTRCRDLESALQAEKERNAYLENELETLEKKIDELTLNLIGECGY